VRRRRRSICAPKRRFQRIAEGPQVPRHDIFSFTLLLAPQTIKKFLIAIFTQLILSVEKGWLN